MEDRKKKLVGTVVGNKMQKTVLVRVNRRMEHSLFHKYHEVQKKVKAHDEKRECQVGDRVLIKESRPLSREKRWVVVRVLEKGVE